MRRAIAVLPLLALLVLPAAAQAGGWASISLSPRPDGAQPGKPWVVNLTVLQHGRTPLTGVEPAVVVKAPDGKERRFAAAPTKKPGVYQARVVFPTKGTYTYTVDDGFTNAFPVTYPPVRVGAPVTADAAAPPAAPAVPAEPGFPWTLFLGAVSLLALIGGGVALALRGGKAPHPA